MKSKYFYPIFKLKIKPWIKYWLIKTTEFKGKLSEILTGFSFNLQNTLRQKFVKFEIEGHSEQETTEGYNMLNLEKYPYSASASTLNGATVTIQDGVITVDARNATGSASALSETRISTADSIESGTYYFGVDVYGAYESTPNTNIWQYKGNRTLTEKFYMKQWKFAVTQGNISSTPILVSNDTSKTNYEPYTGGQASPNPSYEQSILSSGDNGSISEKITNADNTEIQTYTMPVQQPFRSIGDVRDCFVKKSDGWYERHKLIELIADGVNFKAGYVFPSGRFNLYDNNGQIQYARSISINQIGNVLCNKLIAETFTNLSVNNKMGISLGSNGTINLKLDNSSDNSINNWTKDSINEYLQENPFVINVELENPLDLPCTAEQISILENMPSTYSGQTNVYSEDEVVPYLQIQYWESE